MKASSTFSYLNLFQVSTDVGMCCAFNKKEADNIYVESMYTLSLEEFNKYDQEHSFDVGNNFSGKFYVISSTSKNI
jgi:hypothetical protein